MRGFRSSVFIVALAFVMLVAQSVFSRILSPYPFSPYLALPLVFALGTGPGVPLVRGAFTSFVLGYLFDLFTGNPLGVHTFTFVVGYLAARLVGYLSSFRGVIFEMVLTFALTILLGGVVEIIRASAPSGMTWSGGALAASLFASALATAILSPLLFAIVRRIDPEAERVAS